jgi:hypothetical protein
MKVGNKVKVTDGSYCMVLKPGATELKSKYGIDFGSDTHIVVAVNGDFPVEENKYGRHNDIMLRNTENNEVVFIHSSQVKPDMTDREFAISKRGSVWWHKTLAEHYLFVSVSDSEFCFVGIVGGNRMYEPAESLEAAAGSLGTIYMEEQVGAKLQVKGGKNEKASKNW